MNFFPVSENPLPLISNKNRLRNLLSKSIVLSHLLSPYLHVEKILFTC